MEDYKNFLTQTIPSALTKLRFEKKPLWGKMTAQHMVEHMAQSLVASTILNNKTEASPLNSIQSEFRNMIILSGADFPRGLQNPIFQFGLPPYQHADIEAAKSKLVEKIEQFYKIYEANPNAFNYSLFFGDLNFEETQILHFKHFKHHFSQFELL